jgi:hypothetical protein
VKPIKFSIIARTFSENELQRALSRDIANSEQSLELETSGSHIEEGDTAFVR